MIVKIGTDTYDVENKQIEEVVYGVINESLLNSKDSPLIRATFKSAVKMMMVMKGMENESEDDDLTFFIYFHIRELLEKMKDGVFNLRGERIDTN